VAQGRILLRLKDKCQTLEVHFTPEQEAEIAKVAASMGAARRRGPCRVSAIT
jgi:hypothetical protein